MAQEFVSIRMEDLNSLEAYNLLASTVIPRPIAFVSTCSREGIPNLAPFSFFMAGGSNPPSLMYSPTLNENGEPKDSLRNVIETGEFVVNSLHRPMAGGMKATSANLPSETSEWVVGGFTAVTSVAVRPARVLESLVQFECKVFKIVEHGAGPLAARYVIGEVIVAHLERGVYEGRGGFHTISRLGGNDYADLEGMQIFDIRGER